MGIIYKNPALVEVVAEVQWNLTSLAVPHGAAVDPFYDVVRADITPKLAALGYIHVLDIVPPQVPKELLAWKPLQRFSASESSWPKLQLGPGIFSVNMGGPQYTGWPDFSKAIEDGFSALLGAFPSPDRLLSLKSIQLRYIDAFSETHNFKNIGQFTSEYLGLDHVLPNRFIEKLRLDPTQVATQSNTRFPLPTLEKASASIQVADAAVNGKKSCLIQFTIEKTQDIQPKAINLMEWLETAHDIAKDMFLSLVSDDLQRIMKPEEKI
jgi:uncharacterized protein (TIGR04255 family)